MVDGAGQRQLRETQPLASRVVRGGLWVALSSYFNVGFGFAANLVLTRLLAPEDFGVFALATFFFSLVNLRPKIGIAQALAQHRETSGDWVGTHMALDVAAGLATCALAGLAAPILLALGYSHGVVWAALALAGIGTVDSVTGTALVLLEKDLHFGWAGLISSLAFPLSYIPALWLAFHGAHYWALVAQNGVNALLLAPGMWWAVHAYMPYVRKLRWQFSRRVAARLLRFGIMVGLTLMGTLFLTQFDNYLVGTFVGLAALGYYDRAYRVAQWPTVLLANILSRIAFYTYARLQDDPIRLRKTVTLSVWLTAALALPLALAIFVAAPDLVTLLYGQHWQASVVFVRFLVVYSAVRPLLDVANALFMAVGRPKRSTMVSAMQAIVLAAAATPLTLMRGAVGTAIGVGVAFAVGIVLAYHYLRREVHLSLVEGLAVPAGAALFTLLLCGVAARLVNTAAWPLVVRVAAEMSFVVIVFAGAMLAIRPRELVDRCRYIWRLAGENAGHQAGEAPC